MRQIRSVIQVPRNASGSNTPPSVPQSWPTPPPRHTAFTTYPSTPSEAVSEQAFLHATPSEPMSEQAFLHETQSNFSLPRTPKRQCTESEPVTPERKRELLQRRAVKDEFTREEIERDPLYAEETIQILQEEAHQHRHERFLLRGLSVVRMRNRSRSPAVIRPSMALRLRSEEVDNERLKTKHMSDCLLYTSPSPRDKRQSRMPSSA